MNARRRSIASVWVAAVLLAACGGPPATHYYVLEPADLASPAAGRDGATVGVNAFVVDPPYDQDRIVYRVGTTPELGFYAYHRWAAPPGRMLPRVVARALDGAPGIGAVEPAVAGRSYAARLDGRVRALEEVDTADGQGVRVVMTLVLRNEDGAELWSDTLVGESTTRTDRVEEIVVQMRAAVEATIRTAREPIANALGN